MLPPPHFLEIARHVTIKQIAEETDPNAEPRHKPSGMRDIFARLWQRLFHKQHQDHLAANGVDATKRQ